MKDALAPPGPRAKWVYAVIWWMLFLAALVSTVGGVWRGVVEHRVVNPAFAQLGMEATGNEACYNIKVHIPGRPGTDRIDPDAGGCLLAVGDAPVAQFATLEEVARRIEGPAGGMVTLVVEGSDRAPVRLTLERRRDLAAAVYPPRLGWLLLAGLALHSLIGLLLAFAALLLRRKRPEDPVSLRLSLVFLALTYLLFGSNLFLQWLGVAWLTPLMALLGMWQLIVVLPAFPDGRYVPRITRWLPLALPLIFVVLAAASVMVEEAIGEKGAADWGSIGLVAISILLGVALVMLRYSKMPKGPERQQMKWAVFGLAAGLSLWMLSEFLPAPSALPLSTAEFWLLVGSLAVGIIGLALIPAGIVVSLMEYRLNDADAAISKSLGYAVVTLVVGVVWAITSSVANGFVSRMASDPMVATGLSTMMAVLVFAPARTQVLGWTEAKFQRALVRLRALPGKLLRWQSSETPEELADAALVDIVDGVGAAYGAILGDNGRAWRVLAANGIEPDSAMEQLTIERPAERRDDPFPIRVTLADEMGEPDLLAIGPRSDGASYTKDERSAIASIVEPLSAAILACARRERHIAAMAKSLTALEQRLARIEGQGPAAGQASVGEPPARRSSSRRESP